MLWVKSQRLRQENVRLKDQIQALSKEVGQMKLLLQQNSMQLAGEPPTDTNVTPRRVLPYKGLMGTYGQPGYVFRYFCLKQGRKISDFCLKQGQGMRGWAATPHPRIYQVSPPGQESLLQRIAFDRKSYCRNRQIGQRKREGIDNCQGHSTMVSSYIENTF